MFFVASWFWMCLILFCSKVPHPTCHLEDHGRDHPGRGHSSCPLTSLLVWDSRRAQTWVLIRVWETFLMDRHHQQWGRRVPSKGDLILRSLTARLPILAWPRVCMLTFHPNLPNKSQVICHAESHVHSWEWEYFHSNYLDMSSLKSDILFFLLRNVLWSVFMVDGYTFRRCNAVNLFCCLPHKFGSSHKGKNLLPLEHILYCKSRPILGRLHPPGKQIGSYENCLPLKTSGKKMEMYLTP